MKWDPSGFYKTLGIRIQKGEGAGHPFRGNQYSGGEVSEREALQQERNPSGNLDSKSGHKLAGTLFSGEKYRVTADDTYQWNGRGLAGAEKWSGILGQAKAMGFKVSKNESDTGKFYERVTLRHPWGRIYAEAKYYPGQQQKFTVLFKHSK